MDVNASDNKKKPKHLVNSLMTNNKIIYLAIFIVNLLLVSKNYVVQL